MIAMDVQTTFLNGKTSKPNKRFSHDSHGGVLHPNNARAHDNEVPRHGLDPAPQELVAVENSRTVKGHVRPSEGPCPAGHQEAVRRQSHVGKRGLDVPVHAASDIGRGQGFHPGRSRAGGRADGGTDEGDGNGG